MVETKFTKDDVFGHWTEDHKKIDDGMVVARGHHENDVICPIFGDVIPWKSVTVVCDEDDVAEVEYWCVFVHGGDCFSAYKDLPDGKVAIRSNYMAW